VHGVGYRTLAALDIYIMHRINKILPIARQFLSSV
jgi:hypothetical protein